jgi:hypothetical protein
LVVAALAVLHCQVPVLLVAATVQHLDILPLVAATVAVTIHLLLVADLVAVAV